MKAKKIISGRSALAALGACLLIGSYNIASAQAGKGKSSAGNQGQKQAEMAYQNWCLENGYANLRLNPNGRGSTPVADNAACRPAWIKAKSP